LKEFFAGLIRVIEVVRKASRIVGKRMNGNHFAPFGEVDVVQQFRGDNKELATIWTV